MRLKYIERIDQLGGALSAIETGFIQREIAESAFRFQRAVDCGDEIVVGVNDFRIDEKITITPLKVNPIVEAAQQQHLAEVRSRRDDDQVHQLLDQLAETAASDRNLIPIFIECVEGHISLGEICQCLRRIWGEYEAPPIL
jgi:methylmalonyl-CoA mutase N-terminal domain/subunit